MERYESNRGPTDEEPESGSPEHTPSPDERISDDRLYAAVEASLDAMKELAPEGKFSPTQIHGSPMQPDYLAEFTRFEIEEAEAFLRRMGMIVTVDQ